MIPAKFKEFFSSKTNKIYIAILAILCFALPTNVYFLKEVNMVNLNFLFASAIFVAIGSFLIARILKWQNTITQAIVGIFMGILSYYFWIYGAIKFSNHLELTNGKISNYYYKGKLFHIDNDEAGAVWYDGNDENYRVTFVYKDGKKIEYINGEKQ